MAQECPKPKHVGDTFVPKPSPLSLRHCRDDVLEGDDDIWVQAYYTNAAATRIPYYRSLRTGSCRKMEPPTGARRCVRRDDNEEKEEHDDAAPLTAAKDWIRAVVDQPLSKDQIRSIPTPRPNVKVVCGVIAHQGRRRQRRKSTLGEF